MSLTRSRPSPAMIVAALALTLALAGSAIAAPDASLTALSKAQVKRIAKKVANNQITKRAPGLSVAHAKTADNATTAANGTAGHGEFSATGVARAGARNMNNLTISSLVAYIYCEDQAFKSVVTAGGLTGGGNAATASAISRQQLADLGATPVDVGCPASTEWVYATFELGGTYAPAAFQAVGH